MKWLSPSLPVTQDWVALPCQCASVSPRPLVKTTAGSRSQAFKGRFCRPGVEPSDLYSSVQGTAAAAGRAPTLRSRTIDHLLSSSYVTSQMQWHWDHSLGFWRPLFSCFPCQLSFSPFVFTLTFLRVWFQASVPSRRFLSSLIPAEASSHHIHLGAPRLQSQPDKMWLPRMGPSFTTAPRVTSVCLAYGMCLISIRYNFLVDVSI